MPSKYLLADERVIRHVPYSKLMKDEQGRVVDDQGNPYGVTYLAFELRPVDEGHLSVTWCEYFDDSDGHALACAIDLTRKSRSVGPNGGFAIAAVGGIDDFLSAREKKVRFVHEPVEGNNAHALIRRWPADDVELLEAIAADVGWEVRICSNCAVPAADHCGVSERGELPA
jgi:hypothetical protein